MVFSCCVPGCGFNNREIRLHSLPKDPKRAREWCQQIQRFDLLHKDLVSVRRNFRICDRHFDESSKFETVNNRTNLKADSTPTLHLPAMDMDDIVEHKPSIPIAHVEDNSYSSEQMEQESFDVSSDSAAAQERQNKSNAAIQNRLSVPLKLRSFHSTKRTVKQRRLLKGAKQRRNLLSLKKSHLYNLAKEYMQIGRELEPKTNGERIQKVGELVESGKILSHNMNSATCQFLRSQLSPQQQKNRGRRFSLDDKLLTLLLMKQRPEGYKLLSKIFALPSRKSLLMLLKQVPFGCGINDSIMRNLERAVSSLDERARHCVLAFHGISLSPSLSYNQGDDCITGFEDDGETRTNKFADHAMVFMLKGISKPWKQPVAYFFSENNMNTYDVAHYVKSVIDYASRIGLKVVASVCDQYKKSVINALVAETKAIATRRGKSHERYTFVVGEQEVIPLFDPPHLLKGIRNHMLNADVHYKWRGVVEVAKWEHIVKLYEMDGVAGETPDDYRMLNGLTDCHFYEEKMKKTNVQLAAQVFSQRVSSIMRKFAKIGLYSHRPSNTCIIFVFSFIVDGTIPPEAVKTADFLLFVDRLFDSVNSSVITKKGDEDLAIRKRLRCTVQTNTPHMKFWLEAKHVLQTITFVKGNRTFVPPTVTNWIITLDGFIDLWNTLSKSGFTTLPTRNFNLDALENFLGSIRNHGARNIKPTCSSFESSFKSLTLTNFASPHSPGSNCEKDESEGALSCLREFVTTEKLESVAAMDTAEADQSLDFSFRAVTNVKSYMAGYLGKHILKHIRGCKVCQNNLLDTENIDNVERDDIHFRELLRPKTRFSTLFSLCKQVAHFYMSRLINLKNIRARLLALQHVHINNFFSLTCKEHDIFVIFLEFFTSLYMRTYVNNVNKIMRGRTVKTINGPMKSLAWKRSQKCKKKGFCVSRC